MKIIDGPFFSFLTSCLHFLFYQILESQVRPYSQIAIVQQGFQNWLNRRKHRELLREPQELQNFFRLIRIVKLYKSAINANQIKEERQRKKINQQKIKQRKQNQLHKREEQQKSREKTMLRHESNKNQDQIVEDGQYGVNTADIMKKGRNSGILSKENTQQHFIFPNNKRRVSLDDFKADESQQFQEKESKISKILSDMTLKKVIIVVLLLMFLIPLFETELYVIAPNSWKFILDSTNKLLIDSSFNTSVVISFLQKSIERHEKGVSYFIFKPLFEQLPMLQNQQFGNNRNSDLLSETLQINSSSIISLRSPNLSLKNNLESGDQNTLYAIMNIRDLNTNQAYFSMARTTFVCIVLMAMLHFFTVDIDKWIVKPIQSMMNHVMEIAKNPQSTTHNIIDKSRYETALVHNAIVKIGALLSLVFGSAGAEIIGSNLMRQGDINPLIGGKKKCAIFGFCDIRNFAEITQVLQQDIMIFVNTIGELVHSAVYRYGGGANKNIGQAFLLVWKIEQDHYALNEMTNEISWTKPKHLSILADFSIFSFVKALIKINKDSSILDYKKDPRLMGRFGNQYKVSMGFGLHIGWAIEGAIGSEYKIDASYLSPNVNMASRLEAATKQFGIDLLVSQALYDVCSPNMKNFLRNIDRVTVKGSNNPIRLYTIDMNMENITPSRNKLEKYRSAEERPDVEFKKELNMEYLKDEYVNSYDAEKFVKGKKQLRQVMINAVSQDFRKHFDVGLSSYLQGKWKDAKQQLNQALTMHPRGDGPTKKILYYMEQHDFNAPENWKNYRPLTSK